MQEQKTDSRTRPELLADAAIHLIASEGLRSLTHRAVDRAADLPQGSTSYYASTRAALLELVARRLAERSLADMQWLLARLAAAEPETRADAAVTQVAGLLGAFVERLVARTDDMRARFALIVDSIDRDELRGILTSRSPLVEQGLAHAADLLTRLGVETTPAQAQELVVLADSLVFSMTVRAGEEPAVDPAGIFTAYLRGRTAGA